MATPSEKLAQSLELLHGLENANGAAAIRAKDMTRTHRERLLANGFLQEVIKGWYIPSRPDENKGESTAWYASFWRFCAVYHGSALRQDWCLSPEQSLSLAWRQLDGATTVRRAVAARHATSSPSCRTGLPCWIFAPLCPRAADREEKEGLRLFSLESALIECSPQFFSSHATDARAALATIRDASGSTGAAARRRSQHDRRPSRGRFPQQRPRAASRTRSSRRWRRRNTTSAKPTPSPTRRASRSRRRETSPYVNRIRLLWQKMREPVIERFPKAPGLPRNAGAYMKRVDGGVCDRRLSFAVDRGISRQRRSDSNACAAGRGIRTTNEQDRKQRNAMAARGYWQAYQAVQKSIDQVLKGENPGKSPMRITGRGTGRCSRRALPPAC